jgi:hypothetical protein
MKDRRIELLERANLSRTRLASSELGASGQAWKLWSACIAETVDYLRVGTQTYAATLAHAARIDRTDAGTLLRRFDELGIIGWQAAPRASKGISQLTLPPLPHDVMPEPARDAGRDASARTSPVDVLPEPARRAPDVMPEPARSSNAVEGVELNTQEVASDTGTRHSSPSLTSPQNNLVESDVAETGTREWEADEAGPAPAPWRDLKAMSREELVRLSWQDGRPETLAAIRAEIAGRDEFARRILAAMPADVVVERAGNEVGDSEREQMRWRADNPSKVRARRRR